MRYKIEFHKYGVLRDSFVVRAIPAGIVGDYVNGVPYKPDPAQIRAGISHHLRMAFDRSMGWHCESPFPYFRFDLRRAKDSAPMGTIFATFEESNK